MRLQVKEAGMLWIFWTIPVGKPIFYCTDIWVICPISRVWNKRFTPIGRLVVSHDESRCCWCRGATPPILLRAFSIRQWVIHCRSHKIFKKNFGEQVTFRFCFVSSLEFFNCVLLACAKDSWIRIVEGLLSLAYCLFLLQDPGDKPGDKKEWRRTTSKTIVRPILYGRFLTINHTVSLSSLLLSICSRQESLSSWSRFCSFFLECNGARRRIHLGDYGPKSAVLSLGVSNWVDYNHGQFSKHVSRKFATNTPSTRLLLSQKYCRK